VRVCIAVGVAVRVGVDVFVGVRVAVGVGVGAVNRGDAHPAKNKRELRRRKTVATLFRRSPLAVLWDEDVFGVSCQGRVVR
jgi:hypothetical protein